MKRHYHYFLFLIVVSVQMISPAQDKVSESLLKKIDGIFTQWDKPSSPGCALGIIHNGQLICTRGYGQANLEYAIPIDSKSVFRIGSTSKQFTAMAILLLEEQGKLSLDDDIRRFLPDMPKYEQTVTIRHLLHHTSGIRDYLTLMYLAGMRDDDFMTDGEVLDLIAAQRELNFLPGEEYLYSNSGYFLLSNIIQKASGLSLRQFAKKHIFDPLGMKNTHFHDDHNMIVPQRASGYAPRDTTGFQISMTTLDMVGDGGVFTSVDDLLLWDRNFYQNRLGKGSPKLIKRMITPGRLNNGTDLTYASGLVVNEYQGEKIVGHGGAFVGFRAEMIRFPEMHFSVICLANLATMNPSRLARQVSDLFFQDYFEKDMPASDVPIKSDVNIVQISPQELKQFQGVYRDEQSGSTLKISFDKDQLIFSPQGGGQYVIAPIEKDTFVLKDYPDEIEIHFMTTDGKLSVQIKNDDDNDQIYQSIQVFKPNKDELTEYIGDYHSPELKVIYRVKQIEEQLFLHHENLHKGFSKESMEVVLKDEFVHDGLLLNFFRNNEKDISGFSLKAGRVKNIRFNRKKSVSY